MPASQMQSRDGKPADNPGSKEIRLSLPTFTATSEMAAMSRLLGGYHVRVDNEEGRVLGRKIAMYSWPKCRAYFDGTAVVRPEQLRTHPAVELLGIDRTASVSTGAADPLTGRSSGDGRWL